MDPFNLEVTVSIDNPEIQADIENAFVRVYGDIGSAEGRSEYLHRKVEEFIMGVYQRVSGEFVAESARALHLDELQKAATFRRRIDAQLTDDTIPAPDAIPEASPGETP